MNTETDRCHFSPLLPSHLATMTIGVWLQTEIANYFIARARISHGHCRRLAVRFRLSLTQGRDEGGGPLAKNQPEASPRAVSQL